MKRINVQYKVRQEELDAYSDLKEHIFEKMCVLFGEEVYKQKILKINETKGTDPKVDWMDSREIRYDMVGLVMSEEELKEIVFILHTIHNIFPGQETVQYYIRRIKDLLTK